MPVPYWYDHHVGWHPPIPSRATLHLRGRDCRSPPINGEMRTQPPFACFLRGGIGGAYLCGSACWCGILPVERRRRTRYFLACRGQPSAAVKLTRRQCFNVRRDARPVGSSTSRAHNRRLGRLSLPAASAVSTSARPTMMADRRNANGLTIRQSAILLRNQFWPAFNPGYDPPASQYLVAAAHRNVSWQYNDIEQ